MYTIVGGGAGCGGCFARTVGVEVRFDGDPQLDMAHDTQGIPILAITRGGIRFNRAAQAVAH